MIKVPPKQQMFHDACSYYDQVGFGGARGPGKSFSLCHEGVRQSVGYPGNQGAIVRRDFVDLKDTTMQVMKKAIIPEYEREGLVFRWTGGNRPDLIVRMPNGGESLIMWRQATDIAGLMSANLGWVEVDEAVEVAEEFYLTIQGALGRCRLLDGTLARALLAWASNPGTGWPRKYFPVGTVPKKIETQIEDRDGKLRIITRAFIPAVSADNPNLDPAFEARLRSVYSPDWARRFLDGDWHVFEGQVFTEFFEHVHVAPFELPPVGTWREFSVLDWGFTNATAWLCFGLDYDGVLRVWGEHYGNLMRPEQHAAAIRPEIEARRMKLNLADPSCWNRGAEGLSVAELFGRAQVFLSRADNDVMGSIQWLKQEFAARDGLGKPRIVIHPGCVNLIRELQGYRWRPQPASQSGDKNLPDEPMKLNDHAVDCLRYAANYAKGGGLTRPTDRGSPQDVLQDYEQKRRGVGSGVERY